MSCSRISRVTIASAARPITSTAKIQTPPLNRHPFIPTTTGNGGSISICCIVNDRERQSFSECSHVSVERTGRLLPGDIHVRPIQQSPAYRLRFVSKHRFLDRPLKSDHRKNRGSI